MVHKTVTKSLSIEKRKSIAVFLSLSADQILNQGSTVELEEFILENRFPFVDNCDEFWIVTSKSLDAKSKTGDTRFRFLTLFDLIRLSRPSLRMFISIFFKVLKNQQSKKKLQKEFSKKRFKRLISDTLTTTSITSLQRKNFDIEFLVGTNSFLSPGLPTLFSMDMLNSTKIIIWYSINSIPIANTRMEVQDYFPPDFVGEVDEHFVWDQYQKAYLESRGVTRATVKKSMVFSPQVSKSRNSLRLPSFTVSYFDVTPHSGYESSIYSTHASIRTLDELIRILDSLKREGKEDLQLFLKPKRSYSPSNSMSYLQFVDECVSSEKIKRLGASSNLYEVVRQSRVVLAPPFSSPAIIARELGVPCAFYFLPEPDWLLPTSHHGIEVIIESPVLKNFILSAIKKN